MSGGCKSAPSAGRGGGGFKPGRAGGRRSALRRKPTRTHFFTFLVKPASRKARGTKQSFEDGHPRRQTHSHPHSGSRQVAGTGKAIQSLIITIKERPCPFAAPRRCCLPVSMSCRAAAARGGKRCVTSSMSMTMAQTDAADLTSLDVNNVAAAKSGWERHGHRSLGHLIVAERTLHGQPPVCDSESLLLAALLSAPTAASCGGTSACSAGTESEQLLSVGSGDNCLAVKTVSRGGCPSIRRFCARVAPRRGGVLARCAAGGVQLVCSYPRPPPAAVRPAASKSPH